MSAPIILTGLAASDPVPGRYFETNFAAGPASGADAPYAILLVGNKTTEGIGTASTEIYGPDTSVQASTEADYIKLTGAGSPLHRAFLRVTAVTTDIPTYFVIVPESAGAAATGTIVVSGTATGDGEIRVWIDEEFVSAPVFSGDTPTVVGNAIRDAVNAKKRWPVTAAAASGTVTLTAKVKGPRGNAVRYQAAVVATASITTAVTATSDTTLAGGTTLDSNAAALAAILPQRYYYIVSEADDAALFGALVSQVNAQATPTTGIRQRAFCGCVDTLANAITLATGRNAARAEIVWQKNSVWSSFELAANAAAVYAMEEAGLRPETSFVEYGNDAHSATYWKVPPQRDVSARPTRTDIKSALNNGLSPIACNPVGGSTYLVNRITTRSLSGSTPDYRIRPAHKVTIVDRFADRFGAKLALQFARRAIVDDPIPGQNTKLRSNKVVYPALVKAAAFGLIDEFDGMDLLDNAQSMKDDTVFQREASPRTRITGRIPMRPVDNCEQFGIALDQVS